VIDCVCFPFGVSPNQEAQMDIGANGRTYACRAILASAVLSLSCMAFAQQAAKPANTGMLHHISGVWNFDENGGPGGPAIWCRKTSA
jgi:hypothetical protein